MDEKRRKECDDVFKKKDLERKNYVREMNEKGSQ